MSRKTILGNKIVTSQALTRRIPDINLTQTFLLPGSNIEEILRNAMKSSPVQTKMSPCEPVKALFHGIAFITVFGVAMFSLFMNCVLSCLICIYKMSAGKKRKKVR